MYRITMTSIIIMAFLNLNFLFLINTQTISICDRLDEDNSLVKSERIRALCDALQSSEQILNKDDLDLIPDFDLTQIETENEANQILKRFRRSRFSSSSSSSRSGSSSSSSSSGSRFSSGSSSSSSSGGSSRFFSSGSSSSSSGSGSRIFSRSGTSSGTGSSSSSSGTGSRFFSRSGSSSSSGTSSGTGSSSSGSGSRFFSRSGSSSGSASTSAPSGSGSRIFSRSGSSSGTDHRIRESIRSVIRKSTAKPTLSGSGSGVSSGSGSLPGTSGNKPSISDKIRKITHGSGGSGNQFGTGGSGSLSGTGGSKPSISDKIRKITHGSGGSGSQFGTGDSGGSGSSGVWVRAGKKFLPHAVRYGKRYYQRRKYNKGMYAGMGAGTGYYAANRMNHHENNYYPYENYGYPPVIDNAPEQIDGETSTVFYCIQEDLNTTLVNKTLDKEGFGICNISGELITCPIEIECLKSEADNCCEDEQGTPYCCGGPIPEEHVSQYGGYEDNESDGTKMLNIITAIWIMMSTLCFIIWQRRE